MNFAYACNTIIAVNGGSLMKKVSRIMLLVSAIYGLVMAGMMLLSALICLILLFTLNGIVLEEGGQEAFIAYNITMGVAVGILLVVGAFLLVSGLLSFKARNLKTKKSFILCIVFGALADNPFAIVGSILGLISNARNQ